MKLLQNTHFNFFAGTGIKAPYVFLGDEAFALSENMMKPYSRRAMQRNAGNSQRIFNYRLSRARRVVENTFGILAQYFRIYFTPIYLNPDAIDKLIITTCILHNMMRSHNVSFSPTPDAEMDLPVPDFFGPVIQQATAGRIQDRPKKIRDDFKTYFVSEVGSVSWQDALIED